jgi:CelD/BcsL family acetyltransferase involved in cellulose biosynthesis
MGKKFEQVEITEREPSQIVLSAGSWEDYLARLNKNRRYKAKVALRKIRGSEEQKIFKTKTAQTETEFKEMWEGFVALHQKRWNKLGSIGTFYESANLNFHKEVSLHFFKKGWAQMYALTPINDENMILAMDLNYVFKKKMYGAHTVTDFDSEYYKEGPGTALFFETLNIAIGHNLDIYDFLRGDEQYKVAISDRSLKNRTIHIKNNQGLKGKFHDYFRTQGKLNRSLQRKAVGINLKLQHAIGIR